MVRRKDNKGRVLNDGEFQRPDGRYQYQYTDSTGKRKIVYSWKLNPTDKVPSGKRMNDLSLREKEKAIKDDLNNGLVPCGGGMTLIQLVEKYLSTKMGVRSSTRSNYQFITNVIRNDEFGSRRIDTIKLSDAKEWVIALQATGRGYSSIHALHSVLNPAFQLAVAEDLVKKNPFDFKLSTVVTNDSVVRESITLEQQEQFLEFVKNDNHFCKYYDGIYILFNTGLRISEFCGLTISDIKLKDRKIIVDHQLQKRHGVGYDITDTKTTSGKREIPMNDEVYFCFVRVIKNRGVPKVEPMICGKVGFLFLDKNGMPKVASHWEKYFREILAKYNSTHTVQMPMVTPHVCRHTFCSNMAKSGMNPKTLQYIMGHSNISVTLNTYTHINFQTARDEMERVYNAL